jgi:hypothetical protein
MQLEIDNADYNNFMRFESSEQQGHLCRTAIPQERPSNGNRAIKGECPAECHDFDRSRHFHKKGGGVPLARAQGGRDDTN